MVASVTTFQISAILLESHHKIEGCLEVRPASIDRPVHDADRQCRGELA